MILLNVELERNACHELLWASTSQIQLTPGQHIILFFVVIELNYYTVVLIFISLKSEEIEQFFVCLSAYVSSSVKCLFRSFSYFSIVIVFSYWFMGILYIFLITNSLSQICVAFIFQFRLFFNFFKGVLMNRGSYIKIQCDLLVLFK